MVKVQVPLKLMKQFPTALGATSTREEIYSFPLTFSFLIQLHILFLLPGAHYYLWPLRLFFESKGYLLNSYISSLAFFLSPRFPGQPTDLRFL